MIRSMTAFARQERAVEGGSLSLELRSVNHRYLEISMRLPDELRVLEPRIRAAIGAALGRGKVDCNFRFQPAADAPDALELNKELAARVAGLTRQVDALIYNPAPISALEVLRWPGVVQAPVPRPEALHTAALELLNAALAELNDARSREGGKLKEALERRCAAMDEVLPQVRAGLPAIRQRLRERLEKALSEIREQLDPSRLEQELVLLVQKMDVDEELDRFDAHLGEVRRVLDLDQPVGRRLDFLMQELNREANTLGSKSVDTETTGAAVELKVLIEQMREQIQNIE